MGFSVSFTGCVKRSKECWNETHTISASAPAAKTKKKPAGVSQGEREHLLPSEPDKADTQGCDAGAVVDHRWIVRPWEQSCPSCEPEKPNRNK